LHFVFAHSFIMAFRMMIVPVVAAVELIGTPQGVRHPECVVEVPDTSLMKVVDNGVELHHVDGSVQRITTPDNCHQDAVALKMAGGAQPNQWIDEATYTYNAGIDKMTGYNNIPDAPQSAPGTDYWFLGIQNNEGGPVNIVQPVLTYRGAEGWTAASWICCPSNISTTGPTIGPFNEGDRMYGSMERVNSDTWQVDTVINGETSTIKGQVGTFKYNWAVATFEDYGVSQCSQLPTKAVTFDTIKLYDSSNNIIHPQWGESGTTMCNGRTTCSDENTCSIQHGSGSTMV